MGGTVVRTIRRAEAGAIGALARLGVEAVHDAQGRSGLRQPYMRPVWRGAQVAGSAVTALCHPGDTWMIQLGDDPSFLQESSLNELAFIRRSVRKPVTARKLNRDIEVQILMSIGMHLRLPAAT